MIITTMNIKIMFVVIMMIIDPKSDKKNIAPPHPSLPLSAPRRASAPLYLFLCVVCVRARAASRESVRLA